MEHMPKIAEACPDPSPNLYWHVYTCGLYVTAGDICEVNDVAVLTDPRASALRKTLFRTKPVSKSQPGPFDLVN